jgi:hypothetical protein
VITRRSDPRRILFLCVLVGGAVLYAVTSGEDGWRDVIRFGVSALGGCLVGIGGTADRDRPPVPATALPERAPVGV